MDFLTNYLNKQLTTFLPDEFDSTPIITSHINDALSMTNACIGSLKNWASNGFDYKISWQYATFLYFLSNVIWKKTSNLEVPVRLFLLNKALNSLELFYEIELPQKFFLSHTPGLVFAKADYSNYCVFHQGCTVGRSSEDRPILEEGVILYPNSMVIGKCIIRENTVISPGTAVINTDTPGDCLVFNGKGKNPVFKDISEYYADRYFIRK